ncbi:GDSL-type esterase/lipase family protein [Sphingomonas sp. SM33]|uniref:GDSL-type esterase/lipase family protein n=1 Tax=Sphingomonas telluris TaxID=2907998 RepID=A0ABS9VMZ1_9SPHN|nr:GDSL-type esterase/lipase family protein [Sphingomonas telluris]
MKHLAATALIIAAASCSAESGPRVVPSPEEKLEDLRVLPMHVGGRAIERGDETVRQWPGTYFETAFQGPAAYFRVGEGDQILHIRADGHIVRTMIKPQAGLYRVDGLGNGAHRLTIEVASESQLGPTGFGGFYGAAATKAVAVAPRRRQIEFVGDSHTVGYGNTSATRDCTEEKVWETTDTSQAFGPILARRYKADYQVNAISGRGVVRSYDGAKVDSLPVAYPFVLFDHATPVRDPTWQPQLIVISLGTNDFSTQLHAGERWRSRPELSSDFRKTYVEFVRGLRAVHPRAFFLIWTTDTANGEVASEVRAAVEKMKSAGEKRADFIQISGLAFSGCNYHPSLADDRTIADRLAGVIDARKDIWSK